MCATNGKSQECGLNPRKMKIFIVIIHCKYTGLESIEGVYSTKELADKKCIKIDEELKRQWAEIRFCGEESFSKSHILERELNVDF